MTKEVFQEAEKAMKRALDATQRNFNSVRTGRASLALLDHISVDYYGTPTPLYQVATLSVPEKRMIVIQPWDSSFIPAIEKAILKSELGITPTNDGRVVRITIPPLTEERRRELVKVVRRMAEEGRVMVRSSRREVNELLKAKEKERLISEDDLHRALEKVQELTDRYIKDIDEMLAKKEREILEF